MKGVSYFQNLLNVSPAVRYLFSVVIVFLCLNSCVINTEPAQPAAFEDAAKIEQMVGVYKNKGDPGHDVSEDIFLSEIIWPNEKLDHAHIDLIDVQLDADSSLRVTAIANGNAVRSGLYREETDFIFNNGVIYLPRETEFSGVVGPYLSTSRATLGIDKTGKGKYHKHGGGVALVYMFLPAAGVSSSDVRFIRASTQDELLSLANSIQVEHSTSDTIVPAQNGELENEIQKYITVYDEGTIYDKKQAVSGLAWSGIADARLFDIVEVELLDHYQAKTRTIVEELPYLVKALAYSGMEKYRPTISTVANNATAKKLRSYAESALIQLTRYQQWNPIILKGVDEAAPGKLNELRVYNMLRSSLPQLMHMGARMAYGSYLGNDRILAATNQSTLNNYDKNLDQVYQIDAVLWMMKVLAASGRPEYTETLDTIALHSSNTKISTGAEDLASTLRASESARGYIDLNALGYVNDRTSEGLAYIGSVLDDRFRAILDSPPSVREQLSNTPQEILPSVIGRKPKLLDFGAFFGEGREYVPVELPSHGTVQDEVYRLIKLGLESRGYQVVNDNSDAANLTLDANIGIFWVWYRTGFTSGTFEAKLSVRIKFAVEGDSKSFVINGDGMKKVQMISDKNRRKTVQMAYLDFLSNLDESLDAAGL